MPQGKTKNKVKVPDSVVAKKKAKGKAATKRANAPAPSRVNQGRQAKKMKNAITKTVNAAAEEELRALAFESKKAVAAKKASPRAAPAKKTKKK